jgi:hypothetical protein
MRWSHWARPMGRRFPKVFPFASSIKTVLTNL